MSEKFWETEPDGGVVDDIAKSRNIKLRCLRKETPMGNTLNITLLNQA